MSELRYLAAALIVFAAVFHSLLGEKKLITPMLAVRDEFIQAPMTQVITRFGWHASSGFFLLTALIIVLPDCPYTLIWATGCLWFALGIVNLIIARAKHPGGYLLSAVGVLILTGQVV